MIDLRWAPVIAICMFLGVGLFAKFGGITFGDRCTEAGFAGSAHEACVLRLKNHGVMYEENIPKEHE